jgi:hypothetical protein
MKEGEKKKKKKKKGRVERREVHSLEERCGLGIVMPIIAFKA